MVLISVNDSIPKHEGSVCGGSIDGVMDFPLQSWVTIEGISITIKGDIMKIPAHNNPPCVPPNIQSHDYPIDTVTQSWVTIEGTPIVVSDPGNKMDSFAGDLTFINNQGGNSFVTIE